MIWKRNRLYFNDTEIIKLYRYYFESGIIDMNTFFILIKKTYMLFHYDYKIKKPNMNMMYIYLKYVICNREDKNKNTYLIKLDTYINLYRNDEN